MKVTVIIVVGTAHWDLVRQLKNWKSEEEKRPFRRQHYWDWPEYWPEETCSLPESSERPGNAGGKNSVGNPDLMIVNNNKKRGKEKENLSNNGLCSSGEPPSKNKRRWKA